MHEVSAQGPRHGRWRAVRAVVAGLLLASALSAAGQGGASAETTRTLVVPAQVDTMVKQADPSASFGAAEALMADKQELSTSGSAVVSYLRFDVTGLADGETVTDARLTLKTLPDPGGTSDGPAVWRTADTPTDAMTWDTGRPARVGTARVGDFGSMGHGVTVATPLAGVTGNGPVSVELAPASTNGLYFVSREGAVAADHPRLVLTVATSGAPQVTHRVVLNDPPAKGGRDYAIQEDWVKLINGAPGVDAEGRGGAKLAMSAYSISYERVTDALIAAHRRGVDVRFVYNGRQTVEVEAERLRAVLGPSFVHCDTLHPSGAYRMESCIGTRDGGFAHSKILLITESVTVADGHLKNVVNISSSNPTYAQSGQYNDSITTAGDPGLYDSFLRVFNDMAAQNKDDNYGATPAGHFTSAASGTEAWITPLSDSNGGTGEQASTDPVVQSLRPLRGGPGCSVRMEQRHFDSSRDIIAKEFERLRADGGCSVRLLYGQSDTTALGKLSAAGVTLRLSDTPRTHAKFYIVEGTYAGVPGSRLVFTGSHNLDRGSLRYADDVLISFRDNNVVDAYAAQFEKVWLREG